jgi:hypothetical protein
MDALKAAMDGATPLTFYLYERGPMLGQDFSNPIAGSTVPWLHADIAIAQRQSQSATFGAWQLTGIKGKYYNRGAAQGILNSTDSAKYDFFFYTDDSPGCTKIFMATSESVALSATGSQINIQGEQTTYREDNPHCERVGSNLLLFFESDDTRPGGMGAQDIWYTISSDNGSTWAAPVNVSSVNTSGYDGQPHLYNDGSAWWLYCTQTNPADGKLAIWRYKQGSDGDWNSWTSKGLVVAAGTTQGVGEPSLTSSGDLYFVAIFKKTVNATSYDTYDADPYWMKKNY